MKVVAAPDKFRGSLTATQAAAAIRSGVLRARPRAHVQLLPVADGGDGTVDAAVTAGYTPIPVTVTGPAGQPVPAVFALQRTVAVIEMAQASGLGKLPGAPTATTAAATSFGTGELIAAALDTGATRIVLGVGGSACTDGGTGMASALGVRLLNNAGRPIASGGSALLDLSFIDASGIDPRLAAAELIVATDVDNPLLGDHGAARVYAPQKGADPATVNRLEEAMRNLAAIIVGCTGQAMSAVPGSGAAGGIAATALPLLGAVIQSGSDILLQMLGLPDAVRDAALVVTGEGSLDHQSLRGKAPHGVAHIAAAHRVLVVAIAGRLDVTPAALTQAGIHQAYGLAELEPDLPRRMSNAAELVSRTAERVALDWLR